MADSLRISESRAEARSRLAAHRVLLAVVLALQVGLGLVALVAPLWLSAVIGLPASQAAWVRVFGTVQLIVAIFPAPGLIDPVAARWLNTATIAAQLVLFLLFLLLGAGVLAIGYLIAGAALAWTYWRVMRAELMTRP